MSAPRILVFAYSDLGHACLKFLLDKKENVVAVFTHDDKPGEEVWFPSVRRLAEDHSVLIRTEGSLADPGAQNFIRGLAPDLLFAFYYRKLLPSNVLCLPRLGAFNMHGSMLPKYRGRAPVNWAVLNGETETGATLHAMTPEPDAGDIIDQESVGIGPDDTASLVQSRVTRAAVRLLARQIEKLKTGTASRIPQDASKATYFGRRRPEDGEISWSWPAARIHNLVRAVTHPYPGAFGEILGGRARIWKTRLHPLDSDGLLMKCGDGHWIEIMAIQREGESEVTGKEFIDKYGFRAVGGKNI